MQEEENADADADFRSNSSIVNASDIFADIHTDGCADAVATRSIAPPDAAIARSIAFAHFRTDVSSNDFTDAATSKMLGWI